MSEYGTFKREEPETPAPQSREEKSIIEKLIRESHNDHIKIERLKEELIRIEHYAFTDVPDSVKIDTMGMIANVILKEIDK